jgi:hypothetical protein
LAGVDLLAMCLAIGTTVGFLRLGMPSLPGLAPGLALLRVPVVVGPDIGPLLLAALL